MSRPRDSSSMREAPSTLHTSSGFILGHLMKDPLFSLHRKGNKLKKMKLLKVLQLVHGRAEILNQVPTSSFIWRTTYFLQALFQACGI